jgi:hypothetical protein
METNMNNHISARYFSVIRNREDFCGIKTESLFGGTLDECRAFVTRLVDTLNRRDDGEAVIHDSDFVEYTRCVDDNTSYEYAIHVIRS